MLRGALKIKMSALVVDEEVRRRNVPLRGWQRADLSNGEEAMVAERRETPVHSGSDGSGRARPESRPDFGDLGCRGIISFTVACF
jgi:hypothetical protein